MSERDLVWLYEDDLCAIITVDGDFAGIWAHDETVHAEADMIQEWMSLIMKKPENRKGIWMWRVNKDKERVYCEFIKETPDGDEIL